MTAKERASKAENLRREVANMAALGYGNYQQELLQYRRILNDLLILIRDDAQAEADALQSDSKTSLES
jgi:hypothetical protein